jgi:hypothetical protein
MGQCEYHVEVGHAEQLSVAGGEPALARLRLALWAMPVPARIIGDGLLITAVGTRIDVATQCRGTAAGNGSQYAQSLKAEP